MFDRYFSRLHDFVHQHKIGVLGFVLAISAAAGAGLFFTRYEGNIDLMLPPDKDVMRSMNFLRDSSFSDKMIVSLALIGPAKSKKDLFLAADQLASSLTPPLFTKVRAPGVWFSGCSSEAGLAPGRLLVPGVRQLEVLKLPVEEFPASKARRYYRRGAVKSNTRILAQCSPYFPAYSLCSGCSL